MKGLRDAAPIFLGGLAVSLIGEASGFFRHRPLPSASVYLAGASMLYLAMWAAGFCVYPITQGSANAARRVLVILIVVASFISPKLLYENVTGLDAKFSMVPGFVGLVGAFLFCHQRTKGSGKEEDRA